MSIPERIGKYRILGTIGQGGMGIVYKALDPRIERVLALKVLAGRLGGAPDAAARFRQEARSAAQLSHKNIITIFDYDEEDGTAYIAMEYLEGLDLKSRISRREEMSQDEKLRIMAEFLEGLAHAHRHGVIHRDIKPANLFLTNSGQVKILDFGLARLADSDLTRSRFNMGTPAYMAPERLKGGKADHRSDIFAAGVVFYELLTFRRPFPGDSDFAISLKIVQGEIQPFEAIDNNVPPAIAAIVYRMLEKEPEARYQSVDAIFEDFRKVGSGGVNAVPPVPLRNAVPGGGEAPTLVETAHVPDPQPEPPARTRGSLKPSRLPGRSSGWFTAPRAIAAGIAACVLLGGVWLALQRDAPLQQGPPGGVATKGDAPEPAREAPAPRAAPRTDTARVRPGRAPGRESQRPAVSAAGPADSGRVQETRSAAEAALDQAARARADAESEGAGELARPALEQALQTETRARELYEGHQFEDALRSAAKAREEFASAGGEAGQARERMEAQRRPAGEAASQAVEAAGVDSSSSPPAVMEPRPKRAVPTLDSDAMVRRRRGEEIFSLDVEHLHAGGGKCRGELRLGGQFIQYVTEDPGQSAKLRVSGTSLSLDRDRITLVGPAGQEHVFRCRDRGQGAELKRIWDRIPQ